MICFYLSETISLNYFNIDRLCFKFLITFLFSISITYNRQRILNEKKNIGIILFNFASVSLRFVDNYWYDFFKICMIVGFLVIHFICHFVKKYFHFSASLNLHKYMKYYNIMYYEKRKYIFLNKSNIKMYNLTILQKKKSIFSCHKRCRYAYSL